MEFYEVLKTRRSIRSYKPDAVSDQQLQKLAEAVNLAPTACNKQPFKLLLVRDPAMRKTICAKDGEREVLLPEMQGGGEEREEEGRQEIGEGGVEGRAQEGAAQDDPQGRDRTEGEVAEAAGASPRLARRE